MIRREILLHGFPRTVQVHGPLRVARGEGQCAVDHLLDVLARLDLASVTAVLCHNGLLVWHVLDPVNVFSPAAARFAVDGDGRQSCEYEHRGASGRGVVYGGTEGLCAHVDVNDHALRLARQSRIPVGHGQRNHLHAISAQPTTDIEGFQLLT